MKQIILKIFSLVILCSILSCKVNYSFTGASISPETKTIFIKPFPKTAPLGPPSLGQTFTEKMKDKFIVNTTLVLSDRNPDLILEGYILNYLTSPIAIQSNEQAAQNRLTITVTAKFTNTKDEKQSFESTFSRYADYSSSINISSVEDKLIAEINEQLVDDIFNKAVINW